jgi:predicted nucleic acid-binding protein
VQDYLDLPLTRHGHEQVLSRILDLRDNFSAYDATYAALAEGLGALLLTADAHLARAVRARLRVTLCQ